MSLTQLPAATVRLLASSQVITSVSSVVKELMENSYDAGASNIEVRLEKHGLEKIEVKDDGCGIVAKDCWCMALPHYTSKISEFSDLDRVQSYGFRGEALHSLCTLASVTVITKTEDDELARSYEFDHSGNVTETKITHGLIGTTVIVKGLFKNVPVRRQVMSTGKKVADELKKAENVVKSLAVIHPRVRVSLAHNKFLIWQKTSVAHLKLSVMQILNHTITRQLYHLVHNMEQIKIELLIPKKDCDIQAVSIGPLIDTFRLFINKRPVRDKKFEKIFSEVLSSYFGLYMPPNKFPVCFVALTVPPSLLDINLEPNKTKIFIKEQDNILECLKEQLNLYYCDSVEAKVDAENCVSSPKKHKTDSSLHKKRKTTKSPLKPSKCDQVENSVAIIFNDVHQSKQNGGITERELNLFENNNKRNEVVSNKFLDSSSEKSRESFEFLSQNQNEAVQSQAKSEDLSGSSSDNLNFSGKSSESITMSLDPGIVNNFLSSNNGEGSGNEIQMNSDLSLPLSLESNSFESTASESNNFVEEISLSQWSRGNIVINEKKVQGSSVLVNSNSVPYKRNLINFNVINNCPKSAAAAADTDISSNNSVYLVNEIEKFLDSEEGDLLLQKVTNSDSMGKSNSEGKICNSIPTKNSCVTEPKYRAGNQNIELNASMKEEKHIDLDESLNRSVSSQMGKKEMSAFTKFAREMRSEILKESPGMSFTLVASTLALKWKNLQAEEKEKYEKIANEKVRKKEPVKVQDNNSSLEKNVLPKLRKEFERPLVCVDIDMNFEGGKHFDSSADNFLRDNIFDIVGQIDSSDLWVYQKLLDDGKMEIGVLSVLRLQEAYKFHQNMETMAIPVKNLEEPINLSESELGLDLWNILTSLDSVIDEKMKQKSVDDKRITMNGFRINIIEEDVLLLTDVAMNINFYGLEDLRQTLQIIKDKGEKCSVTESRCLNAVKFIRSETVRQCPMIMAPLVERSQVTSLINVWWNECKNVKKCPHSKDVIFPLHTVQY